MESLKNVLLCGIKIIKMEGLPTLKPSFERCWNRETTHPFPDMNPGISNCFVTRLKPG